MPHRIAGIDIGSDSIKATFFETSFRSFSIVDCREVKIPPVSEFSSIKLSVESQATPTKTPEADDAAPDEEPTENEELNPVPHWVFGLAKFIQSPGIYFNDAVVAVPGRLVSTRIIELPFTDGRKIEQVLPIEVENFVPFDIDRMVLSYQILQKTETSSKILISLVSKENLARFLEHLKIAGLDPAIVDISANGLINGANLSRPDDESLFLLLHIGSDQSDLVVMKGKVLIGLRSIPMGRAHVDKGQSSTLANRLNQTIQSLRMELSLPLETLAITGPLSENGEFLDSLSESLGLKIEPFTPFGAAVACTVPNDSRTNSIFAKSMGLGIRLTSAAPKGQINLRKGEFTYRRAGGFFREELKKIAVMGSILLVLLVYNLVYAHMQNKKGSDAVREQIVEVFNKTFPGQRVVNPVEQFRQNMEQVYTKYRIVGHLGDGDLRAIEILKHISESVPKTVKIDVKKLDIQQDRVTLEGVTDNFEKVDKIENALRTFPGFKEIKKDSATKTANEAIKFKFNIKISSKGEAGIAKSLLKGN